MEKHCTGERFIGAASNSGEELILTGTPGNALGCYMNGAKIIVHGNGQDAVGDTMNDGSIIIHGNVGDAVGYGMRGGKIYIKGNGGYRAGIHMKAYKEKMPCLIIGGKSGSFTGEYQAGGLIIVLGIGYEDTVPVGNFCGTGMHGGRIFIRTENLPWDLPAQVSVNEATAEDISSIALYIDEFSEMFGFDSESLKKDKFYLLTPNSNNPYKQMYVAN